MGAHSAGLFASATVVRSLAVAAALLTTSCFSPATPADCTISCASDLSCPAGLTCTPEGLCAGAADLCGSEVNPGDEDGGPEPAVLGDVLTYTFDGPLVDGSVWDRSGSFAGGHFRGDERPPVPGRWGTAAAFGPGEGAGIEVSAPLGDLEALTFEAWVAWSGTERGVLIGDRRSGEATYELSIEADGTLQFLLGDCEKEYLARSTFRLPSAPIESPAWRYVAVTWDGEMARLYHHDGDALAEEAIALAGEPCPAHSWSPYLRIGSVRPEGQQFEGLLDEVKVSSRVKTPEELSASRLYDSTALVEVCGDGYVEGGEECETSACCDPQTCRRLDDVPCGAGATCESGVCGGSKIDLPEPLVDYGFDEGSGTTIGDDGAAGLDLSFDETAGVAWSMPAGELSVRADVQITSAAVSSNPSFMPRLAASDAITVEVVVRSDRPFQSGPARILTVSEDNARRDFLIAQDGTALLARLTTSSSTDLNGVPSLIVTDVFDKGPAHLHHIVYTRAEDGRERMYVDGVLRTHSVRHGTLEWPNNGASPLRLAHEGMTPERYWHGDYARIRIFDQALSEAEVGALVAESARP